MRKENAEKGSLNQYNFGRRGKGKRNLEGEKGKRETNRNRERREVKETKLI
jgi:hypothetical protein